VQHISNETTQWATCSNYQAIAYSAHLFLSRTQGSTCRQDGVDVLRPLCAWPGRARLPFTFPLAATARRHARLQLALGPRRSPGSPGPLQFALLSPLQVNCCVRPKTRAITWPVSSYPPPLSVLVTQTTIGSRQTCPRHLYPGFVLLCPKRTAGQAPRI
jgi:hypothetical protein